MKLVLPIIVSCCNLPKAFIISFLNMAKPPITTLQRFDFYDQVEVITAKNYLADFPIHFHETICITMVCKGIECTRVGDYELINPVGGISLTNANEAHANPNLNEEDYSFVTYYINPEVIKHFTHQQENHFPDRVVLDHYLYQQFLSWKTLETSLQNERSFAPILSYLAQHYISHQTGPSAKHIGHSFNEAIDFMEAHWNKKLHLETLAKITSQNKYAFIRSFKKKKGITPGRFLLIKRLEAAKRLLKLKYPIVEVTYECGFFDQSHFTNCFKQYTGLTPQQYRGN